MKTIDGLEQGSPQWLAHRRQYRNASEASAVMGASPYVSRAELIRRKATGIEPEVSEQTQGLFDRGHAAEAASRPLAEAFIGEDLYPMVGVSDQHPTLSASFDGVTLDESIVWEAKLWNEAKADDVRNGKVPAADVWQCIQQLVVSGAQKLLYTVSDGTPERTVHCWMTLKKHDESMLLSAWDQFDADVAAYVPEAPTAVVLAAPVESLPAVAVRLDGKIAVIDNLDVFGERLRAFVERIDRSPETDQAFADAEAAVKELKRAEDALEAAEANALAQIDPVETMRRTVADLSNLARTTRLLLEKIVKVRKDEIRVQVAAEARTAYCAHLSQINATLAVSVVESPTFTADVAGAIKGKRSLDNLRADVSQVVANYKIAASTEGNRHHANIAVLAHAGRAELFQDRDTLVRSKQPDDLANLVKARIADADKAEQARLDAERAKIRAEEEARAQREAERLAEQERAKVRAEEQALALADRRAADEAAEAQRLAAARANAEAIQQPGEFERRAQEFGINLPAQNDPQPSAPETPAAVAVFDEADGKGFSIEGQINPGNLIKLGEFQELIAPLIITAEGLRQLGFPVVSVERNCKLYRESDIPAMCRAMGRVLKAAMEAPAMKEAA